MQAHPEADQRQPEPVVDWPALLEKKIFITSGPISSSPNATASPKAAIASTVTLIAWRNSSA